MFNPIIPHKEGRFVRLRASLCVFLCRLSYIITNIKVSIYLVYNNFSPTYIAFVYFFTFAGLSCGTIIYEKLIYKIHDLKYIVFIFSGISSILILHMFFTNSIYWIIIRFLYGIGIVGSLRVFEDYFNSTHVNFKMNKKIILSVLQKTSSIIGRLFLTLFITSFTKVIGLCVLFLQVAKILYIFNPDTRVTSNRIPKLVIKKIFFKNPLGFILLCSSSILSGSYTTYLILSLKKMSILLSDALYINLNFHIGEIFIYPIIWEVITRYGTIKSFYKLLLLLSICNCILLFSLFYGYKILSFIIVALIGGIIQMIGSSGDVLLQKDEVNSIDRHDLSYTIAIIKYLAGGFSAILFFLFVKISFNGILVPIIIFTLMLSGILKYNNF